jgi:hypothetical protein
MQFAVNFAVWQFCSNEMADEIEEFFASRVHPSLGGALWLGGGGQAPPSHSVAPPLPTRPTQTVGSQEIIAFLI